MCILGFVNIILDAYTLTEMDENRYRDLVNFLQSPVHKRIWPKWITQVKDSQKKRNVKTNFRAMANGTVQRAGFMVQNDQLYKKVFKDKKTKTLGAPRLVVKAKEMQKYLKIVHDKAGHVGVGNTRRNCIKEDSLKIWWKGINDDIEKYKKNCSICIKCGVTAKKSGELQSNVPPKKHSLLREWIIRMSVL